MRYLVAVDGWEPSRKALAFAVEQADAADAALDVVHVVDEDGGDPDAVEQMRGTVDDALAEHDGEVPVDVHVLEANKRRKPASRVGTRILEFVGEHDHDLVFVGNEHTSAAERMIVGSVSATLIDDRSVPVVLVP